MPGVGQLEWPGSCRTDPMLQGHHQRLTPALASCTHRCTREAGVSETPGGKLAGLPGPCSCPERWGLTSRAPLAELSAAHTLAHLTWLTNTDSEELSCT